MHPRKPKPRPFSRRGFDRDRMHMASSERVAEAAMAVIDTMQVRFHAEEQVLGAAAVFLILCEHFQVPSQDAFTATTNLMNTRVAGISGTRPEFLAVAQYAREELGTA